MMEMPQGWSNRSVLALAAKGDPIEVLIQSIRKCIFEAMDQGFVGPPYDPIELASYLGINVSPSSGVKDACVQQDKRGNFLIAFNPTRPKPRINFSIAHELAHTFFPDCGDVIRHRHARYETDRSEWELELLCNLGAAEILMPSGSFPYLKSEDISIDNVLELRKKFHVSTEAVIRRLIHLTDSPCFTFSASRSDNSDNYFIDYFFSSKSIPFSINKSFVIPHDSIIKECLAIGYTAKATEKWSDFLPTLKVECVGLQPYHDSIYPRVVGVVTPLEVHADLRQPTLKYVSGDVLTPRGGTPKIIAHIVNNRANRWGGRGVANAVANKWPEAFMDFDSWRKNERQHFALGNSRLFRVSKDIHLFSMVAQSGYGPSENPRVRYAALEHCLAELALAAQKMRATVHLPKIGTGYGGGDWTIISELLDEYLVRKGVVTTVYEYRK